MVEDKKQKMKTENKVEETKQEEKMENKIEEKPTETKKEEKKKEVKVEKKKRTNVSVQGLGLHMSPKAGKHICDMIRAKDIDLAIKMMEEVIMVKRAVPMNNREIGHRHGMAGGRYPVDASKEFLHLLKGLKSSAIYHEMELEKSRITECYTNVATKPYKRGGARAKRAHVFIKLEMKIKPEEKKNKTEQKMEKK